MKVKPLVSEILGQPEADLALSQTYEVEVFHRRRRSDNGITDVIEIGVVSKGAFGIRGQFA